MYLARKATMCSVASNFSYVLHRVLIIVVLPDVCPRTTVRFFAAGCIHHAAKSSLNVCLRVQVQKLMTENRDYQLEATCYFRKLLSIEKQPPIEEVVRQPRVVERLVEFLGYDQKQKLQFEAAWALTNVRLYPSPCVHSF